VFIQSLSGLLACRNLVSHLHFLRMPFEKINKLTLPGVLLDRLKLLTVERC
jgi:hypothetical protein